MYRVQDYIFLKLQQVQMQSFSQKIATISKGINYLIPQYWFQQFQEINDHHDISNIDDLYFPQLYLDLHVDNFILQYQQQIKEQLNQRCNSIGLNKIIISPEPFLEIAWRPIPPTLWKQYKKYNKNKQNQIAVYTYFDQQSGIKLGSKQIRIVFQQNFEKCAFIGHFDSNTNVIKLLRALIQELGFQKAPLNRITLVGKSDKSYYFSELQQLQVQNIFDCVLLVHSDSKQKNKSKEQSIEKMVQQVAVNTDIVEGFNDGNQSTGLDFSFINEEVFYPESSSAFKPFRSPRDIFKNKKPQDVILLKRKAKQAMKGQLIYIPMDSKQQLQDDLQQIAEQLLYQVQQNKKKSQQEESLTQFDFK